MNKFYIDYLGCKVNTYEIEAIKDALIQQDFEHVVEVKDADYIIINTCCVTNTAASKSRQRINSLHKENTHAKVIVMGCYVQGFSDEVIKIDGVSLLVGTKDRNRIVEYIVEDKFEKQAISLVEDVKYNKIYEDMELTSYCENTRAYLKIQDGCNNFCSYCIIPYVRGTIKSRNHNEVIKEAQQLIKKGYKEIVLTGIHTGSYGKDLDDMPFSKLVEMLLDLPGLYRLRISSIEESEIDDKLIDLLKTKQNLAKHLHIPLQAGSDHVLKLMNRKYDLNQYITKVKGIQNKVNDVAITTDIIVGFPQESEDDFESTLRVSKEIGFSKIHVFPYSSRKGTVAAKMSGQINGIIKKQRSKELIQLSNELNKKYNETYINKVEDVLVEEKIDNYYIGHTSNFIKVKFQSSHSIERNAIIKVKIISVSEIDANGVIQEEKTNEIK